MPDGWFLLPSWFPLGPLAPLTFFTTSGCPKVGPGWHVTLAPPQQVTSGCPKVDGATINGFITFAEIYQSLPSAVTMSFSSGPISVKEASLLDETNGRNWTMPQAYDVKFLAVRGTIMIGEIPLYYQFTLVKYLMYIDTVPWTIFSTLEEALDTEFDPHFFTILTSNRRDRWGFLNVARRPYATDYDVDTPYLDTGLSIFDTYGHTRKEVKPFQYTIMTSSESM